MMSNRWRRSLIILACTSVVLFMLKLVSAGLVMRASDAMEEMKLLFFLFRVGIMAAIWWFWEPLVRWLLTDPDTGPKEDAISVYVAQRSNVLIYLLFIELVVIQNLIGLLIGWAL
jgi:cytochrome b561